MSGWLSISLSLDHCCLSGFNVISCHLGWGVKWRLIMINLIHTCVCLFVCFWLFLWQNAVCTIVKNPLTALVQPRQTRRHGCGVWTEGTWRENTQVTRNPSPVWPSEMKSCPDHTYTTVTMVSHAFDVCRDQIVMMISLAYHDHIDRGYSFVRNWECWWQAQKNFCVHVCCWVGQCSDKNEWRRGVGGRGWDGNGWGRKGCDRKTMSLTDWVANDWMHGFFFKMMLIIFMCVSVYLALWSVLCILNAHWFPLWTMWVLCNLPK